MKEDDVMNNILMKYKKILKFSLSSIISFIIDYSFFTIFSLLISNNISVCNVLARIISATCNYTMNRKFVFNSNNDVYKSVLSYIMLAFIVIILNTLLLNLFVYKWMFNKFIAKIIVEIILFIMNYFVQRKIIFKKDSEEYENNR